jgi:hypothetical protein
MSIVLPDARYTATLLGMLFEGLTVKPGAKLDLAAAWCAVYIGDDGLPGAFCACDLAFAANGGAALSLLPPGVAKDAVRERALTDVMRGNLHEVMNICTRLVVRENAPHFRLSGLMAVTALPPDQVALLKGAKARVDFEIGIPKYGSGLFAVLSV